MSQVSAPIRAVALIGMLAALAVGAWSFMGSRGAATSAGSASADSSVAAVAKNPVAAAQAVAGKLSAHNNATAAGNVAGAEAATATKHPAATAKPAAAPATPAAAVTAKPAAPKAKPAKKTTKNATRMTIASLLVSHPAVVVLLYDPQSQVDAYSLGEAQLGASRANAGFVAIDVLNQRQVGSFTEAYGVLQDPSVLFFARPGKLVQKLSGFADHDTVAQAAINAEIAAGASAHTLTQAIGNSAAPKHSLKEWAAAVNSVCVARGHGPIAPPPGANASEQAAYFRASDRWMAKSISAAAAVPLPSAAAARATAEQFISLLKKERSDVVAYLQASSSGDHAKANAALGAANAEGDAQSTLAQKLNMTACQ